MQTATKVFVPRAQFVFRHKINWFPGHMRKGIRDIGKTLRNSDLILEVHDARIPFSGRNLNLIGRISSTKPVILLLNKCDLIESKYREDIIRKLEQDMDRHNVKIKNIFFMDSLNASVRQSGYDKKFLATIIQSIEKNLSADANRGLFMNDSNYNLLVMGIPNVGKSTVINRLRNVFFEKGGKPAEVGAKAGVTRAVMERIKICDSPRKIYLYDTPGVLEPSFQHLETNNDREAFMRCALCGNISDSVAGHEIIADYLLYWLNKTNNLKYVENYGLPGPSNSIVEVLTHGAVKLSYFKKAKPLGAEKEELFPLFDQVAEHFVRAFRKGEFGKILLDQDKLGYDSYFSNDETK